MNIHRFRSENLAFESLLRSLLGTRWSALGQVPPGGGKSHIKVKGMLVAKLKFKTPKGRLMWAWLKLKLIPKGDHIKTEITAFLKISLCAALSNT